VTAVTQSANGFCLRNAQFLRRVIDNSPSRGQVQAKLKTQGLARWWKYDKANREGTLRSRFHKKEEEKEVQGH
jgi:hypothetical protein